VLVLGAGPIGAGVALFARMMGAAHVVVSERAAERRALALELGATATIDAVNEDVAARFHAIAGKRPDVVFECVGVRGVLQQAIAYAGLRGRVVVAGVCTGEDVIMPVTGLGKEVLIQFSQAYTERDFAAVLDAVAQGRVDVAPMRTATIGFDAVPEAFETLMTAPKSCKVLIDPKLT
jgi:(R,R)-butanediol dehydrogenase/meso-butanediol dehydrogenase/diacetyl reductase